MPEDDGQIDVFLPEDQFWVLVIGAISPVVGYLQNKLWPNAPEGFKAFIQALLAGVVGGAFSALANDVSGFDNVAQHCFSAIVAALFAHNILWKPANVNVKIGARPSPTQTPSTVSAGEPVVPGAGAPPANIA
jgi:hypothetical protein